MHGSSQRSLQVAEGGTAERQSQWRPVGGADVASVVISLPVLAVVVSTWRSEGGVALEYAALVGLQPLVWQRTGAVTPVGCGLVVHSHARIASGNDGTAHSQRTRTRVGKQTPQPAPVAASPHAPTGLCCRLQPSVSQSNNTTTTMSQASSRLWMETTSVAPVIFTPPWPSPPVLFCALLLLQPQPAPHADVPG